MNLENQINEIEDQIVGLAIQMSQGDRSKFIDRVLNAIHDGLMKPRDVKFKVSRHQRVQCVPRLAGMEFFVTRGPYTATVVITSEGKFKTVYGEYSNPSSAIHNQWKKTKETGPSKDTKDDFTLSVNGWMARNKDGKSIDDCIRELILKEIDSV